MLWSQYSYNQGVSINACTGGASAFQSLVVDVMEDVKKSPDDGEGIVPSLFALVMVLPKAVADIPNDGVPSMMLSLLLCPRPPRDATDNAGRNREFERSLCSCPSTCIWVLCARIHQWCHCG